MGQDESDFQGKEEILSALVATCLARMADGVDPLPFDEICAEHPHLRSDVVRSVEKAARIPAMHSKGAGGDRMIGKLVVGRYRISERIGSGAMGVVYAATDLDLGRKVAVKVTHGRLLEHATAVARFDREASALAAVRHESVVTIHDRGVTDDGSPFLVMELIEGVPCSKILEHAKALGVDDATDWMGETFGISASGESSFLRQAVRWMADVAGGLGAAHSAGVYHRDVKPSNIIVRPSGHAVLLDFGIAAIEDQDSLTRSDAAVGTPVYMAPEMLKGAQKARPSHDIYGVAATLYHLVTQEPPYRGNSSEVLTAIATRDPMPAVKVRPGLPRDAQAILDNGLARNPQHRYASMNAIESDLRAFLSFRPVSVRPTSTIVRVVRRASRSKLFIGAALATVTIALALAIHGRLERWRADRIDEQAASFESAWPGVPANFPVAMGSRRGIASAKLRSQTSAVFDALVASGYQRPQCHVLRAIFRLDHGDIEGALADARAYHGLVGSDFSREYERRVAALGTSAQGPVKLDLREMPEAVEIADLYASTLHAFRKDGCTNHWKDPRLDDIRHVKAIRLGARADSVLKRRLLEELPERIRICEEIVDEARRTLVASGYGGATLTHAMATARGAQLRYSECLALSRQVLQDAPASPATLLNAGETARLVELFEEARGFILQGLEVTPGYLKMEKTLALIEAGDGHYEEAQRIAKSAPFSPSERGQLLRVELLASVEALQAYLHRETDPAASRKAATRLLELCSSIPEERTAHTIYTSLAKGILEKDDDRFFHALFGLLEEQPSSARLVGILAQAVPAQIDKTGSQLLANWLHRLHVELAKSQIVAPGRPVQLKAE